MKFRVNIRGWFATSLRRWAQPPVALPESRRRSERPADVQPFRPRGQGDPPETPGHPDFAHLDIANALRMAELQGRGVIPTIEPRALNFSQLIEKLVGPMVSHVMAEGFGAPHTELLRSGSAIDRKVALRLGELWSVPLEDVSRAGAALARVLELGRDLLLEERHAEADRLAQDLRAIAAEPEEQVPDRLVSATRHLKECAVRMLPLFGSAPSHTVPPGVAIAMVGALEETLHSDVPEECAGEALRSLVDVNERRLSILIDAVRWLSTAIADPEGRLAVCEGALGDVLIRAKGSKNEGEMLELSGRAGAHALHAWRTEAERLLASPAA